jgi:hypothetical protein
MTQPKVRKYNSWFEPFIDKLASLGYLCPNLGLARDLLKEDIKTWNLTFRHDIRDYMTLPDVDNLLEHWLTEFENLKDEFLGQGVEAIYVDSSPTSIVKVFEKIAKGAVVVAHKLVLSQKRIAKLEAAHEAATKRKSRKRKQIRSEGTLTVEEGVRSTTLKEFNARSNEKKAKKRAHY